jgi:hypothetical protein
MDVRRARGAEPGGVLDGAGRAAVEMRGSSAAGRDSRGAALPPVEIRVGRSAAG